MKKSTVVLAGVALLMAATSAIAVPLGNGPSTITSTPMYSQPSLQTIANNVLLSNDINVYTAQTGVGGWTHSDYDSTAFEVAFALGAQQGEAIPGTIGIYDLNNPFNTYDLINLAGAATRTTFEISNAGALTINNGVNPVATGWSKSFGFYLNMNDRLLFTEDDKNFQNNNMAATYRLLDGTRFNTSVYSGTAAGTFTGGDDWLIAFDWNYLSEGLTTRDFNDAVFMVRDMSPVPEPGTIVLLGAGLLGLGFYGRRRSHK